MTPAAYGSSLSRHLRPSALLLQPKFEPYALLRLRGGFDDGPANILSVETEEDLDVALEEAGSKLVVVDFFAEWCGPCKKIAPLIDSLARKSGSKVVFAKVPDAF